MESSNRQKSSGSKKRIQEFSCAVGLGSSLVTAVAWVMVVAWVASLVGELPHAVGAAKRKKKKENRDEGPIWRCKWRLG